MRSNISRAMGSDREHRTKIICLCAAVFTAAFFLFIPPHDVSAQTRQLIVDTVGSKKSFYVEKNYDALGRDRADFILKKANERALIYIDAYFWESLSPQRKQDLEFFIERVGLEFDRRIYPILTEFWGDAWNPGIDDDPRISIAFGYFHETAAGYYNYGDEVLRSRNERSNEREIIYVNARFIDHTRAYDFVAHEFQHLITYNQKELRAVKEEEIWANEMRSEFTATILGYNNTFKGSTLEKRSREFLQFPSEPTLEWSNNFSDYAAITMFAEYLYGRFGENFFREMMRADSTGIASINDALAAVGSGQSFEDVYADWVVAGYFNDISMGTRYYYKNENLRTLRVSPTLGVLLRGESGATITDSFHDWTPNYYRFEGQNSGEMFRLSFIAAEKMPLRAVYITESVSGKKTVYIKDFGEGSGLISVSGFGTSIKNVVIAPIVMNKRRNFTDNDPVYTATMYASAATTELNPPIIVSADKRLLNLMGGDMVTVRGSGFVNGAMVFVNMKQAVIQYADATSIVFVAPKGDQAGGATLKIVNPTGESVTSTGILQYAPHIPEGALIRAIGDYKVYIVNAYGFRRHILNPQVFSFYQHFQWEDIIDVDPSIVDGYKESHMAREEGRPKVYEIDQQQQRHWLDMMPESFTASGRNWGAIFIINAKEMALYKDGETITR